MKITESKLRSMVRGILKEGTTTPKYNVGDTVWVRLLYFKRLYDDAETVYEGPAKITNNSSKYVEDGVSYPYEIELPMTVRRFGKNTIASESEIKHVV